MGRTKYPAPHLLIALSKGFAFKHLFEKKLSELIVALEHPTVTVLQDNFFIAKEYFFLKNISIHEEKPFSRTSIKKKLDSYSHIIIFWDGDDLTDLIFFAKLINKPLRLIPVEITKVRNKDKDEPYDIYIGRGTPWGNPFPMGMQGMGDTREDVINKYREYFVTEILADGDKRRKLMSLRGYRLGCHCKPLACHGDIIAEYLNSQEPCD